MRKLPLGLIAFLQAFGLALYCGLVGTFFWNAEHIFPCMNSFLGPTLLLLLFVFSAIICAVIFGYNTFIIFWEQKNTKKAIKLVLYTSCWLLFFALLVVVLIALRQ